MPKTKPDRASELRDLQQMKDRDIDTTDIPPVFDWGRAAVGKFFRPTRKPLAIRLDPDGVNKQK